MKNIYIFIALNLMHMLIYCYVSRNIEYVQKDLHELLQISRTRTRTDFVELTSLIILISLSFRIQLEAVPIANLL